MHPIVADLHQLDETVMLLGLFHLVHVIVLHQLRTTSAETEQLSDYRHHCIASLLLGVHAPVEIAVIACKGIVLGQASA